jgi:hypothetical protein
MHDSRALDIIISYDDVDDILLNQIVVCPHRHDNIQQYTHTINHTVCYTLTHNGAHAHTKIDPHNP